MDCGALSTKPIVYSTASVPTAAGTRNTASSPTATFPPFTLGIFAPLFPGPSKPRKAAKGAGPDAGPPIVDTPRWRAPLSAEPLPTRLRNQYTHSTSSAPPPA